MHLAVKCTVRPHHVATHSAVPTSREHGGCTSPLWPRYHATISPFSPIYLPHAPTYWPASVRSYASSLPPARTHHQHPPSPFDLHLHPTRCHAYAWIRGWPQYCARAKIVNTPQLRNATRVEAGPGHTYSERQHQQRLLLPAATAAHRFDAVIYVQVRWCVGVTTEKRGWEKYIYIYIYIYREREREREKEREGRCRGREKGVDGWAARYRSGFNAHRSPNPSSYLLPSRPTTLSTPSTIPRIMHSSASLSLVSPFSCSGPGYHGQFEGFLSFFIRKPSLLMSSSLTTSVLLLRPRLTTNFANESKGGSWDRE